MMALPLTGPPGGVAGEEEARRLGRADPRAGIDALYRLYAPMVFSNLYLMLKDGAAARDLTQEVFVKGFTQEGFFDGEMPFRPWLLKVGSRLALNHIREGKRRVRREIAEPEASPDPLDQVLDRQIDQELARHVMALPIAYRQAVVLRYHAGLSTEEIARVLEVPVGTVVSHLFRARLLLRRRME